MIPQIMEPLNPKPIFSMIKNNITFDYKQKILKGFSTTPTPPKSTSF
jgi:hypothetical protein